MKKKSDANIVIKGARENNLKNLDLVLPRNSLIVFTGVSGSGKSSFVFDTIYAEGQRRYVESLSSYARQFLERKNKPDVDLVTGISPAIAIEQKSISKNSRSTVGTTTEIYDYFRLLYARIGKTHCFSCGEIVTKATTSTVAEWIESQFDNLPGSASLKYYLTFPLKDHEGKSIEDELTSIKKRGYFRIVYNEKVYNLNEDSFVPDSKSGIRIIVERVKIEKGKVRAKLGESIEITFKEGEQRLILINADTFQEKDFNKFYECCGIRYEEPEPRFFSFNNPFGACPVCQGFSRVLGIDPDLIIPNQNLSLMEGAIAPFRTLKYSEYLRKIVLHSKKYQIPIYTPYKDLSPEMKDLLFTGTKEFTGINEFFENLEKKSYKLSTRMILSRYKGYTTCSACKGSRLRREALQVKIYNHSIFDLVTMSIKQVLSFFKGLELSDYEKAVSERIVKEIIKRLTYLIDVGLSYLTLDRLSHTLSGGETQRINLATALGSSLVGTLYILDEPSIGLHPRDNEKLIAIMKSLKEIGNSVIIVEHDPEIMKNADLIIDMGPKAGLNGGEIVFRGTFDEILNDEKSLTGKYLSGKVAIPIPEKRRELGENCIEIIEARENNLKNIDVKIPLNVLVVVTGVSGSGKSTLIHDVLYSGLAKLKGLSSDSVGKFSEIKGDNLIDAIEIVDQSPIGKSPRSNPISFIKGFEIIRDIFANQYLAKSRGYKPGYFSFNIPGGRCETCQGDGMIKIEMQFLADIFIECEDCKGTRYKKEIRDITYKEKSIVDILNMTVDDAFLFFEGHERLRRILRTLQNVGMGYIKLGQPSNTLSGGEAQRIKLASHISTQRDGVRTLFIFDEPSTGLHFDDIQKLINCFNLLIDNGSSVIIIEHNLEIIKCADHIIDLGPDAGAEGGKIIASGTPEVIAQSPHSITGKYLKDLLLKK